MHTEAQKGRVAKGRCASCGQQLYRMKPEEQFAVFGILTGQVTSDAQGRRMRRIPLTIPNLVENGRCLHCATSRKVILPGNFTQGQLTPVVNDQPVMDTDQVDPEPFTNTPLDAPHSLAGDVKYYGSFNAKGEKHGLATVIWPNGDVYDGYFENDLRNGKGTMVFASNAGETGIGRYDGFWIDDIMHGKGCRKYPNGDSYDGEYLNGKRHGEGRFHYANGDMFWGSFEDNEMHGFGRYYYASGQRFEGEFFRGQRCGRGKLQCKDGRLEIFQYMKNERIGKGIRWSSDRAKAWLISAGSNDTTNGGTQEPISISDAVQRVNDIEQAAEQAKRELLNA